MISGTIPCSEKGISVYGHKIDKTPFCPCLDENLSPITGFLVIRNLKFMLLSPEIAIASTFAYSDSL